MSFIKTYSEGRCFLLHTIALGREASKTLDCKASLLVGKCWQENLGHRTLYVKVIEHVSS